MNTSPSPFTADLYRFLTELEINNNRQWFNANKDRYINDVRDPMSRFIMAMQEPLKGITAHVVADPRPVGGSMFRIYRDTRFSKDKTPYKTHAAIHFRHKVGKDVHGPGLYFHMGPKDNGLGGGIWHPDSAALRKIRDRIAGHSGEWGRITQDQAFVEAFGGIGGDQLKRMPRDFDAEHPFADDLRRKDFFVMSGLTRKQITNRGLIDEAERIYRIMTPLMTFLAKAVGLGW